MIKMFDLASLDNILLSDGTNLPFNIPFLNSQL